jgi:hypothetical protein
MKRYHLCFFILIFLILLLIGLVSLKIIPFRTKILIIIDFIFKLFFGAFIIVFFSINKYDNLEKYDRLLIILSGFLLLMLIDYIEVINILFNIDIIKES